MERFPILLHLEYEYTFEFSRDDVEFIFNEILRGNHPVRAIANNCIRLLGAILVREEDRALLRSWERVVAYFGGDFPTDTLYLLHKAILSEDLKTIDRLSHRDI